MTTSDRSVHHVTDSKADVRRRPCGLRPIFHRLTTELSRRVLTPTTHNEKPSSISSMTVLTRWGPHNSGRRPARQPAMTRASSPSMYFPATCFETMVQPAVQAMWTRCYCGRTATLDFLSPGCDHNSSREKID